MARARRFAKQVQAKSGSPIETLFGASVLLGAFETGFPLNFEERSSDEGGFTLRQQVNISKYRVDFLFEGKGKKLVVECDGRDFHHSTKDQIERDRARDAELSRLGYTVFRFPGTQISNDVWGTVVEVLAWLDVADFGRWYDENKDYTS